MDGSLSYAKSFVASRDPHGPDSRSHMSIKCHMDLTADPI